MSGVAPEVLLVGNRKQIFKITAIGIYTYIAYAELSSYNIGELPWKSFYICSVHFFFFDFSIYFASFYYFFFTIYDLKQIFNPLKCFKTEKPL